MIMIRVHVHCWPLKIKTSADPSSRIPSRRTSPSSTTPRLTLSAFTRPTHPSLNVSTYYPILLPPLWPCGVVKKQSFIQPTLLPFSWPSRTRNVLILLYLWLDIIYALFGHAQTNCKNLDIPNAAPSFKIVASTNNSCIALSVTQYDYSHFYLPSLTQTFNPSIRALTRDRQKNVS